MELTEEQKKGVAIRDKLQRAIFFYEEINALLHDATEEAVTQNRISTHNYLSMKYRMPALKLQFENLVMDLSALVRG